MLLRIALSLLGPQKIRVSDVSLEFVRTIPRVLVGEMTLGR